MDTAYLNNFQTYLFLQLKEEIEKLQEAQAQPEASNSQLEVEYVKKLYREREDKHKSEIDSKLNIISKLETDLEEQKTKNNVSIKMVPMYRIFTLNCLPEQV